MLFGALETGGTKMIAAILNREGVILERNTYITKTPDYTIPSIIDFFRNKNIISLGIGSFGPLNLDKNSPDYGTITTTPKKEWTSFPLLKTFRDSLLIPVGIETDVNAAALGEAFWGCSKEMETSIYITIGTGIGAGIIVNGRPIHGAMHPECGHILITPRLTDPMPNGICPYHHHCFEGLASGTAIRARWGKPANEISDSEVWDLEAEYIAEALVDYTMILSPQKIILGGGVMKQKQLFPLIRDKFLKMAGGYLQNDACLHPETFIVPESLNGNQALLGCLKIAMSAVND